MASLCLEDENYYIGIHAGTVHLKVYRDRHTGTEIEIAGHLNAAGFKMFDSRYGWWQF